MNIACVTLFNDWQEYFVMHTSGLSPASLWWLLSTFLWGDTDQERMGHDCCSLCLQVVRLDLPVSSLMLHSICIDPVTPHQRRYSVSSGSFDPDTNLNSNSPRSMLAVFGDLYLHINHKTEQSRGITNVYIHPEWNIESISSGWVQMLCCLNFIWVYTETNMDF